MLKHIVMFKLPERFEGQERKDTLIEMKKKLEALPSAIAEIKFFRVGLNVVESATAFEIVIDSDFENVASLNAYTVHSAHQEVVKYFRSLNAIRAAVDYEY